MKKIPTLSIQNPLALILRQSSELKALLEKKPALSTDEGSKGASARMVRQAHHERFKRLGIVFYMGVVFMCSLYAERPEWDGGQMVSVRRETKTLAQCSMCKGGRTLRTAWIQKPSRRRDVHRLEMRQALAAIAKEESREEVLQEDAMIKALRSAPVQRVVLNFTAATVGNVIDPYIIPPNLNGSVGSQQYILMTYNVIRSFNKTTGLADGVLNIDAAGFFGESINDVRINYDRFSQRWFMSCEGLDGETGRIATLILAVSRDSVITQATLWDFYTFSNEQMIPQLSPLGTGDLDYQQLAVDQNAVYISVDTFDQNGYFTGTSVVVIQKSSLGGDTLVSKVFSGILEDSAFVAPADNFDSNPAFGYLINALGDQYPSSSTYNTLYFYRIINPGSVSPSLSSLITITVPSYTNPANASYKGNLFSSSAFLQTSGSMVCTSHVRKHQLYVCHNIQVNAAGIAKASGDRVGVRWYQFDLTGDVIGRGSLTETSSTVPVLVQSGTLFDTSARFPLFYFVPAIMTDKNGALVIACSVSGAKAYPNVVFAGRKANDPRGVLRNPVRLTAGSYPYNFGPFVDPSNGNMGQRWGDASSLSPDPVNDLDIWSTQEFAAVQNGWGVKVTKLAPV